MQWMLSCSRDNEGYSTGSYTPLFRAAFAKLRLKIFYFGLVFVNFNPSREAEAMSPA